MTPDTYAILRQAIVDRQQVVAVYKGHPRELCPHVLGTKNGVMHALCFQFGGSSPKGLPPGGEWRCFEVARLAHVASRPGEWHTGAGYGRSQRCVDAVDVAV